MLHCHTYYTTVLWSHGWDSVTLSYLLYHHTTGWSTLTVRSNHTLKTEQIFLSLKAKLFFNHNIGSFWFLVSKKIHKHSVINILGRLLGFINVKVWKMPWKLKFSESQYCFANISATEARIFIKFYVVVNYYLVSLCFKFREDPCISARARVVNARAHVLSRVRACTTFARAFFHGSPWNLKLKLTI